MYYSQVVDYQKINDLLEDLSAPNLDELANPGHIRTPNPDEIANKIGSFIHNKILFAILDTIDNPAKSEIAMKITENRTDPATLQFLVDRLGPGIKTVIRDAFDDAIDDSRESLILI